jgi:hypothetical protein
MFSGSFKFRKNQIAIMLFAITNFLLMACGNVKSNVEFSTPPEELHSEPAFKYIFVNESFKFAISGGVPPYSIRKISGTGNFSLIDNELSYTSTGVQEIAQVEVKDANEKTIYISVQVSDPTAPLIQALLTGEPGAFSNSSQLNVTVGGQGVVGYRYALADQSLSCTDIPNYSSTKLISEVIDDVLSAEQSYRLCVIGIALDGSEQLKALATQVDWRRDVTPPLPPTTVVDGDSSTSQTTSPVITFVAGSDTGAGISNSEVRIFRSGDNISMSTWTTFASGNTVAGLTLDYGSSYYAQIRHKDLAGNYSSVASGDGWSVTPPSPPVATFTYPEQNFVVNAQLIPSFPVRGTCTEIGKPVQILSTYISAAHANCNADNTFSVNLNYSTAPNGPIVLTVAQEDYLGQYNISDAKAGKRDSLDPGMTLLDLTSIGNGDTMPMDIVRDSVGNFYVTGFFDNDSADSQAIKDFNGDPLLGLGSAVARTAFIAKVNSNGSQDWIKRLGGLGSAQGRSLAVDGLGNVYLTGTFNNNTTDSLTCVDFSGSALLGKHVANDEDVFVAKLNSSGSQLWIKVGGSKNTAQFDWPMDLAVDRNGNVGVIVMQEIHNNATDFDFTETSLGFTSGVYNGWDAVVYKFDTDGNQLWWKLLGGTSLYDGINSGIVADSAGNWYVLTSFTNTLANANSVLDFLGDTLVGLFSGVVASHTALAKLSPTGGQVWIKKVGSVENASYPQSISIDSSDNLIVGFTAQPSSSFRDFANAVLTSRHATSSVDHMVAKLDKNGIQIWINQFGGTNHELSPTLGQLSSAVDGAGNVYIGGNYTTGRGNSNTVLDFSGQGLIGIGGNNLGVNLSEGFVAKLRSSDGSQAWVRTLGGEGNDYIRSVTADANGEVYYAASFENNSGNVGSVVDTNGKAITGGNPTPHVGTLISRVNPADKCATGTRIGLQCNGGAIFLGIYESGAYMITPGGCGSGTNPVCNGNTDTLTLTWNNGSSNWYDVPGVLGVATASEKSTLAQRGDTTTQILAQITEASQGGVHAAAKYCEDLVFGGYSDWYLPSKSELAYVYCRSRPGGTHNPSYPQDSPNCTEFGGKFANLDSFAAGRYWTSTELTSSAMISAWTINFTDGEVALGGKSASNYVRCIRRY